MQLGEKVPAVNIELAAEITSKGAVLPDGQILMTADQMRDFIRKQMDLVILRVTEVANAKMARDANLVHDLKEY